MKIHLLYDASGQVIAAAELPERSAENTLQVRPVAKSGQYTADFDVPPDLADLGFTDLCEKLVVDTSEKVPRLKART